MVVNILINVSVGVFYFFAGPKQIEDDYTIHLHDVPTCDIHLDDVPTRCTYTKGKDKMKRIVKTKYLSFSFVYFSLILKTLIGDLVCEYIRTHIYIKYEGEEKYDYRIYVSLEEIHYSVTKFY